MSSEYISFLKKKELIFKEDNIFYAERAFRINSITHWCLKQDQESAHKCLFLVNKYINNDINLELKDDELLVSKLKT